VTDQLTRRALLAVSAGLIAGSLRPAGAALPPSDQEAAVRVAAYLDGVRSLKSRFEQLAPNGSYATGMVYLQRPGRLRFDYDPPSKVLLIAQDWRLIFQDASVKQINVVPVAETPLGFLLADKIELSGAITVTQVVRGQGEIAIRVIRTNAADQGSVILYFAKRPMELRRWSVTDAQGLTTQIILVNPQFNVAIDADLFRWRDPQLFGWPER
jgi:outer membrane lipoprotein-sorting protein